MSELESSLKDESAGQDASDRLSEEIAQLKAGVAAERLRFSHITEALEATKGSLEEVRRNELWAWRKYVSEHCKPDSIQSATDISLCICGYRGSHSFGTAASTHTATHAARCAKVAELIDRCGSFFLPNRSLFIMNRSHPFVMPPEQRTNAAFATVTPFVGQTQVQTQSKVTSPCTPLSSAPPFNILSTSVNRVIRSQRPCLTRRMV